ncbi:DNA translocase FtsK 4TM domain-containing protein [Prevotella sp. E15-22]|uniref:FtsK/SpoIIIE family DNA translocase n=1 Tax=Prevotella sp. E15-22 TaxID=2937774 RepID=UPI003530E6D2
MAKKKSKKSMSQSASPSMLESLGLRHISQVFQNERLHFFLGMLLFALSVCLTWAFVSYFTTGAADQSIIENLREGDLENEPQKFGNAVGSLGAYAAYFFMNHCFGVSSFGLPLLMFLFSLALMKAYKPSLLKWFICVAVVMEWFSVALAKFATPLCSSSHFCPGGEHGLYVCRLLERYIGSPGLVAILIIVAILFLMYVSSETIVWIRKILNPMGFVRKVKFTVNNNDTTEVAPDDSYEKLIQTEEDPEVFDNPQTQVVDFGQQKTVVEPVVTTMEQKDEPEIEITVAGEEEKADDTENPQVDVDNLEPYDPKRDLENYHYPTLDLLNTYESDGKPYIDMEEQTANKNRIIEVLRTFGIEISSIKATVGPTITLYEITPAQGVRISKIRGLEDDIALSLKALGIRIIAPIPGKGTIGIEVPNAKANIVSMESILNSKKFQETTMELPCAMGKTITNEVFMFDLAKAPHLLVAGATGQGKSVGLNAILTSLLYKKHPAEMKIVLVDPKMVEFSIYAKIANHFLAKVPDDNASPIITDTTKVIRTLQSLCVEMDARYELLMAAGERNIKDYNRKFIARKLNPEKGHKFMPYIVVVIDEYGDLIMTAGKEIELPIARIAQKARAVGIHMIIATQRPTTNIITGTIKANFPARIAFKVSQGIDSKTILDRMGAQQLIGRGDMLYLQGNDPVRVQCAFVDTPEVDNINQFIAQQQGYLEPYELPEPPVSESEGLSSSGSDADLSHLDPMFDDAARLIVHEQSGSTSLIQRKFAIGYNRAGRLMDQLEKAGIVGQAHGSKPREVLIQDDMSLENLLNSLK